MPSRSRPRGVIAFAASGRIVRRAWLRARMAYNRRRCLAQRAALANDPAVQAEGPKVLSASHKCFGFIGIGRDSSWMQSARFGSAHSAPLFSESWTLRRNPGRSPSWPKLAAKVRKRPEWGAKSGVAQLGLPMRQTSWVVCGSYAKSENSNYSPVSRTARAGFKLTATPPLTPMTPL